MNSKLIAAIIAVIVITVIICIVMFKKKEETHNFLFTVKSTKGLTGTLSPDGKQIVWNDNQKSVYKRLTPIGSDPTNLNDGSYVPFPTDKPYPLTGAPGENVVNWINNDVWPIKLVTLADGTYAVFQNGRHTNTISNFK